MADNIDTRVSPALDPERFRLIDGYNDDTRKFVDGVVSAYNDIYVTLGKIHDARRLADSNGAWNEEQKLLIVGKEASKQKDRVLARMAGAERTLRATIEHTENELSRPLTERAGLGNLNGEVRAHAKALKRNEREAFMREALERDDKPTLEAILGAQPFLSGMSPEEHAYYLRTFHEQRNPHLVQRLDLMKRFMEEIERNTLIVHRQFDRAVGAKPAYVSAIDRRNEEALAALRIEPTA